MFQGFLRGIIVIWKNVQQRAVASDHDEDDADDAEDDADDAEEEEDDDDDDADGEHSVWK